MVAVSYDAKHTSVTLAVCGDPITSKALVLLLQSYGYHARLISTSSLELDSLEGIGLLLLTPSRSAMDSAALGRIARRAQIPTLELTTEPITGLPTEEGEAQREFVSQVPWPCSSEVLRRRIENKLQQMAERMNPVTEGTD